MVNELLIRTVFGICAGGQFQSDSYTQQLIHKYMKWKDEKWVYAYFDLLFLFNLIYVVI